MTPEIPPVLHGDGVTDDTDAVQWYLDRDLPLPPAPEGGCYLVNPSSLRFEGGFLAGSTSLTSSPRKTA